MSHRARLRFWSRMADLLGLGRVEWRAADDGGWLCHSPKIGVPHIAHGPTAADALAELVRFARRVRW